MKKESQKTIILNLVSEWAGGKAQAEIWYCNEIIPALAMTAEMAVKSGQFNAVIDYLKSIELGGYA